MGRAPIFDPLSILARCQLAPARDLCGTRDSFPTAATFRSWRSSEA